MHADEFDDEIIEFCRKAHDFYVTNLRGCFEDMQAADIPYPVALASIFKHATFMLADQALDHVDEETFLERTLEGIKITLEYVKEHRAEREGKEHASEE